MNFGALWDTLILTHQNLSNIKEDDEDKQHLPKYGGGVAIQTQGDQQVGEDESEQHQDQYQHKNQEDGEIILLLVRLVRSFGRDAEKLCGDTTRFSNQVAHISTQWPYLSGVDLQKKWQ